MAGYTRQSAAQIVSGEVISAAPINAELNQVLAAFNESTGHSHDGTSAEGPPIDRVADADQRNMVLVDTSNNHIEFYNEVGGAATQQVRIQDGAIVPITTNDIDLGTASLEFKDMFIDGTAHIDTLDVDVNATVAGTLGVTGALTGTNITASTAFLPDASDGASLGTTSLEFSDLYLADGAVIRIREMTKMLLLPMLLILEYYLILLIRYSLMMLHNLFTALVLLFFLLELQMRLTLQLLQ